jgi:hypothetical protein
MGWWSAAAPEPKAVRWLEMQLTELEANQTARVTYKSVGCFHKDNVVAVFEGQDLQHPRIAAPDLPDIVAEADVSEDDLRNLDLLFEYWRKTQNERSSAGTTDCDVSISWRSGETEVDLEEFAHAFPPPNLVKEYVRLFIGIMKGAVEVRKREIDEAKRKAFIDSATENHPFKEIRFLDNSTLCALLDAERARGVDARKLASNLSKLYLEHMDAAEITFKIYNGNQKIASYTYKKPNPIHVGRLIEIPLFAVFGLIVVLGVIVKLLWWPFGRLHRWRRDS